jgi:NAD-dependent protein deacetylase/lipoamidase
LEETIDRAAAVISDAHGVAVFSGAGISAESGIPTFRGSGGLWERYPPSVYGSLPGLAMAFLFRKKKLAAFARDALRAFVEAEPNPAHTAIARLEDTGKVLGVITQNIDDLHQAAGSTNVLQLHGTVYRVRCARCGATQDRDREALRRAVRMLEARRVSRRKLLSALNGYLGKCACGGRNRPDAVFFGEPLPKRVLSEAIEMAYACDCLVAVGSSALVQPAASIPPVAARTGSRIVEVNPVASAVTPIAEVVVAMEAGKAMPLIVEVALRLSGRQS